uniref:Uncharacterized protein n=8 Tax=Pseudomonadota TaxID=1224 RepID=Q6I6B9_ECOLX|nr:MULTISPECIES: hypothetical protein [Pseudomonadota]ACO89463.1 hypothetical protein [Cloning vector pPSX]QFX79167.1 hypothetical protein pAN70-1000016 [Alcaligenes faecalis]BAD24122.1 hypothetical protein [Escherichia coli]BAF93155.1 hypothetical protein [Salmonella enterica subsp. enterica serovar Dublin]FAA00047.1 TPA: hypothetical protein [Escherichia coli]
MLVLTTEGRKRRQPPGQINAGVKAMKRKFRLGQMLATIGVLELCKHKHIDLGPLIDRHVSGDWGDVDDAQREANEEAVKECGTIVSVYHPHGVRVLIVTDGDRSHTVAMLPHEY